MASTSQVAALTPSQAIRSSSGGSNTNTGNNAKSNNGRQRWRNNNKEKKTTPARGVENGAENPPVSGESNNSDSGAAKKRKPRNRKKKGNNDASQGNQNRPAEKEEPAEGNAKNPKKNLKKKNNNRKNNRNRKRYPWRKHIPAGTVDPITLDNLASLPYPPFALRAAAPYLPVPEWPPKEEGEEEAQNNGNDSQKNCEDAKERERRLLREQWGNTAATAVLSEEETKLPAEEPEIIEVNPKHLNLCDGRALAYYMVSQLQFIDPLTRRDISRDELCHLDRYLVKNGFTDLNVVEAYDTKGVSLSTAGAASTTAAGRMEILQQEARVLLNALFGGQSLPPSSASRNNNNTQANSNRNSLMQQYSNYQAAQENQQTRQQREEQQPSQQNNNSTGYFMSGELSDMGIYGEEGMMVIDDDLNPSMRGASQGVRPYTGAQPAEGVIHHDTTLWAAGRITGQHGTSSASNLKPQNFPALSTAATLPPDQSSLNSSAPAYVPGGSAAAAPAPTPTARPPAKKKPPLPPVNSLKFITKAVKKTTPEEIQRQFEAREEARRRAQLSQLTFGSNPASWGAADMPQAPSSLPQQPTERQLERNRAVADALGLASTTNKPAPQSWARPTDITNVVLYPGSLILTAREKMGPLLKLERKWKAFLEDDKAASLPLNPMKIETRAFVHEYSDFWKIHTESFDREPKRYIHCVKLMDTSAPYPLLSDAARQWRGPTGRTKASHEPVSQQTAGQDTRQRSPVTIDLSATAPLPSANSRAAALASERPKLELKERTLPLELPPFQPLPAPALMEVDDELLRRRQIRIEEQKRREQEREERKQRALEAAFASDDEQESLGEVDADSDWEEGEELYAGSDDEDGEM